MDKSQIIEFYEKYSGNPKYRGTKFKILKNALEEHYPEEFHRNKNSPFFTAHEIYTGNIPRCPICSSVSWYMKGHTERGAFCSKKCGKIYRSRSISESKSLPLLPGFPEVCAEKNYVMRDIIEHYNTNYIKFWKNVDEYSIDRKKIIKMKTDAKRGRKTFFKKNGITLSEHISKKNKGRPNYNKDKLIRSVPPRFSEVCQENKWDKNKLKSIYECDYQRIKRWMIESGNDHLSCFKSFNDSFVDIETFKKDCSTHYINEIVKKYEVSASVIFNCCDILEIDLPTKITDINSQDRKEMAAICEDNMNRFIGMNRRGKTISELSEEYDIPSSMIRSMFKDYNIPVRLHSYNKSKGEIEVLSFMKGIDPESHSRYFKYKDGTRFEVDCYSPKNKLGVEYCGEYWHNKNRNHIKKMNRLKEMGISLIVIYENEWKNKKNVLKSMISARMNDLQNKIHARKCKIRYLDNKKAREFHEINHINGHSNSNTHIGLEYNGRIVSLMSFGNPRWNKENYTHELIRFSSSLNTIVVGGASKIIKEFSRGSHGRIKLVTYCDLRFGNGRVYDSCGMNLISHNTGIGYFYYNKKTGETLSRHQAQKHKLKNLLGESNFNPDKTEKENMLNNGYFILYDCGNKKYEVVL